MRSVVKTRRQNIGRSAEYVNEDPETEFFPLSLQEHQQNTKGVFSSTEEAPLLIPREKIADLPEIR